ncbi:hypothetical protein [Saccharophagus degradans]|uniref:DUF600 family protein n=1 Tax=Saccharophagus degradans TaxID=86304 RepID=A0AAW7X5F6_9GAMM|nr:hypothetical protein [Saccharophagus degradans]MDO6422774.1 hypothetical protein [Saccharophagus degradans]MDO6606247.1 hypothetical protein [Saccharophagus degradans]
MFNTDMEIYQYLATCIVKAIPVAEWSKAEFSVLLSPDGATAEWGDYFVGNEIAGQFDIDDGAEGAVAKTIEASKSLYEQHQRTPDDKPFNKYKFTLNNDGTFDLEFKYDNDFEFIHSIHPDSNEYDAIDTIDMRAIKSWEGLPQDHPRPWLQQ